MYGVVAGITAFGGVSALAGAAAHADSTFTFTRIGGADRYATAGLFTAGAFPGGATSIYLADGLPGHQSDALAASGWGGVNNYGALLTDNTSTVPANTTSALSNNKVKNVVILGGTNAVSQAQQTALTGAGYTVTRIAGATRLDTMQALDDAIPPASVGKDSGGNATAILASGDDNHLVDALSAGGVAYGMKFPVILTSSSSSTLPAQAQQVITALGIKHLVVVGGTAAVPASQYSPAPTGVTKVDVEGGADRSATSMVFSDFAISQTPAWAKNSKMELARGDDGADALASAPYSGITDALSTCVTLTPNDPGSCPAFAAEHKATLTGPSIIAGLQAAVTDAAATTVAQQGGGGLTAGNVSVIQSSASPGGTINGTVTSPGSVQSLTVSGCGFSSQSVTFDSGSGNFTLTIPTSATSGSCNLTFTATKTAAAGGGTQTTTVPFTVGSGATAACGVSSVPTLCSSSIISTTTASQSTSSNAAGTVIQYVFNQSVSGSAFAPASFKAWPADDGVAGGYTGAGVCGSTAACAASTNANAVNVLFTQTALQSTTGTDSASTLTLATVARGAVTTTAGAVNAAGNAPIGTASTNTPQAGVQLAPNLESVGTPRAASAANSSAIDLTFDKAAFPQNVGAGTDTTDFDIVFAAGVSNTGGAGTVAGTNNQEANCTAPQASNPVNSGTGLTVPGFNTANDTITVVCPNPTGSSSQTITTAQIARMVVQNGAVGTTAVGGSGDVTNALQVSDSPHSSAAPTPSLTGLTLTPGASGANDEALFTFDTGVAGTTAVVGVNPSKFNLIGQGGNAAQIPGGAGGAGTCSTSGPATTPAAGTFAGCQVTSSSSTTQVALFWGNGTFKANATVGANVANGAVSNSNNGFVNADDELGAANSAAVSTAPGTINAVQLKAGALSTSTNAFGSSSTNVTWVFNYAVTVVGGANFHAYTSDGTELTCAPVAANVGSGANNNTVTCTPAQMFQGNTAAGTNATAGQLAAVKWVTVDYNAVTGNTTAGVSNQAPNANPNPEGGAAAS